MTGREFKKLRLQLGLTQEALATKLDKTRISISRWENGHEPIPRVVEYSLRYFELLRSVSGRTR